MTRKAVALTYCSLIAVLALLLIIGTQDANAASIHHHPGHTLIVFQCDAHDEGRRELCEHYIIAANPQPDELGEATATHRYELEVCDLSRRGFANNCDVSFVPKGDQIIAPYNG